MATHIKVPVDTLRAQLEQAIAAASDLPSPDGDVTVFSSAYQTWDKRNEIMLEQSFSADGWLDSTPKSDYTNAFGLQYPFGVGLADEVTVEGLASDLDSKVDRLQRICDTLDVYSGTVVAGPASAQGISVVDGAEQTRFSSFTGGVKLPALRSSC